MLSNDTYTALLKVLENDPRPAYQNDNERIYSFEFAGYNVKFLVEDNVLVVKNISRM